VVRAWSQAAITCWRRSGVDWQWIEYWSSPSKRNDDRYPFTFTYPGDLDNDDVVDRLIDRYVPDRRGAKPNLIARVVRDPGPSLTGNAWCGPKLPPSTCSNVGRR
jgi:hypothetical protein